MGYWDKFIKEIKAADKAGNEEKFQKAMEEVAENTRRNSNKPDGEFCAKCGEFYQMAEPNQPDGTLICWRCRNP